MKQSDRTHVCKRMARKGWCRHEGCSTRAAFGEVVFGPGLYCGKHRPEGLVSVSPNPVCELCGKCASYADELYRKPKRRCAEHKEEHMVCVSARYSKKAFLGLI